MSLLARSFANVGTGFTRNGAVIGSTKGLEATLMPPIMRVGKHPGRRLDGPLIGGDVAPGAISMREAYWEWIGEKADLIQADPELLFTSDVAGSIVAEAERAQGSDAAPSEELWAYFTQNAQPEDLSGGSLVGGMLETDVGHIIGSNTFYQVGERVWFDDSPDSSPPDASRLRPGVIYAAPLADDDPRSGRWAARMAMPESEQQADGRFKQYWMVQPIDFATGQVGTPVKVAGDKIKYMTAAEYVAAAEAAQAPRDEKAEQEARKAKAAKSENSLVQAVRKSMAKGNTLEQHQAAYNRVAAKQQGVAFEPRAPMPVQMDWRNQTVGQAPSYAAYGAAP